MRLKVYNLRIRHVHRAPVSLGFPAFFVSPSVVAQKKVVLTLMLAKFKYSFAYLVCFSTMQNDGIRFRTVLQCVSMERMQNVI